MLRMLIKDLRINPLRSFLTGSSMFLGILAVILSVVSGTVGQSALTGLSEQLYGRPPTFTITGTGPDFGDSTKLSHLAQQLRTLPGSTSFVAQAEEGVNISTQGNIRNSATQQIKDAANSYVTADLLLTSSSYPTIFNIPISQGAWFSDSDAASTLSAVVNTDLSSTFPLGSFMYLSGPETTIVTPVRVVGIVNDGSPDSRAYVNALSLTKATRIAFTSIDILWYNTRGLNAAQVNSTISDVLHDTTGGRVSQVEVNTAQDPYGNVIQALQLTFALCALLLLLVSAIGLLNIGLATLETRTRELLIRRSLGATKGSITALVIGGSLLLALIVSFITIGISIGIVAAIPLILPPDTPISPPSFPIAAALVAIGSATLTALVGSFIPALRAARLEPALALR